MQRTYSSTLLDIGSGAKCSEGAACCPTGEPLMQQASTINLVDFAMGPRDSGSFRLTPVIALASRTAGLPVRLRYLRRVGLPEVASACSRGRLAGASLVFLSCRGAPRSSHHVLWCGLP